MALSNGGDLSAGVNQVSPSTSFSFHCGFLPSCELGADGRRQREEVRVMSSDGF